MEFDEILAPAHWRRVDFISDIHLQEGASENMRAWEAYLASSPADAIFILGDLFEVWVGDDVLDPSGLADPSAAGSGSPSFEGRCAQALRACSRRASLYFMRGNRDFLVGEAFAQICGLKLIQDPSVLAFGEKRYLLSHGDALCLADVQYQQFRQIVRGAGWQTEFLSAPLAVRQAQARGIRQASQSRKQDLQASGQAWIDIDSSMAVQWMDTLKCQHFIHGHTHEGRDHDVHCASGTGLRHVLPDWHLEEAPPRGYVLRLSLSEQQGARAEHVSLT
jgi:UDP-2,3-diacylglucosamine hydrolase